MGAKKTLLSVIRRQEEVIKELNLNVYNLNDEVLTLESALADAVTNRRVSDGMFHIVIKAVLSKNNPKFLLDIITAAEIQDEDLRDSLVEYVLHQVNL